jgi:hypothetical protein
MAKATKRQTQSALRAIRKAYGFVPGEDDYIGPRLVEQYHGWHGTYRNVIVWEEGPYEWAINCSCATCRDEGVLEVRMPKGTYAEAINGQALGLYKA